MVIKDFRERGASVRGLCEGYLKGAPAHAAMLVGPPGVGKRTLAGLLAQSLFCTGQGEKPCGHCPGCKKYASGSHPDAYRLHAEKKIGVEEVRSLIAALASAPYEGGWRTVVIEDAGSMTVQAQNSLLKTLEEAPPKTVFLLTATSGTQLLATIRSRCQVVQLSPLPVAAVQKVLENQGIQPARAAQLADLSQGSIGQALAMENDATFWALRGKVFGALTGLKEPSDVLVAVNALKDERAEAGRICDLLEAACRNALSASLTTKQAEDGWAAAISRLGPGAITKLTQSVLTMRRMLASNVSWQAVWERFLLEYMEEMKTWQL